MSDFRFALGDYANVPHFISVQGSVHAVSDHIIDGKRYLLAWISGPQQTSQWFTADEMAAANAPVAFEAPAADTLTAGSNGLTIDIRPKPAAIASRIRNRKGKPARKKR